MSSSAKGRETELCATLFKNNPPIIIKLKIFRYLKSAAKPPAISRRLDVLEGFSLDVGCGENPKGDVNCDGIKPQKLPSNFIICDAHNLPFRDSLFDSAYMGAVIEHSPNPLMLLEEVVRILKLGGMLRVITDYPSFWRFHLLRDHGEAWEGRYGHYMLFFPSHIERLLSERLNMQLSGIWYIPSPNRLDRPFIKLPFLWRFFHRFFCIEARKLTV